MKLYVATSNKNKLKEISSILSELDIEVQPHPDYENLDVKETGSTFQDNAKLKAIALSKLTDEYVIADDSGISVEALNGAPGVYSARFAGENAGDEENNNLLLKKLEGISNRKAKFECAIALAKNAEIVSVFYGNCDGNVGYEPSGKGGFGYDPLFVLEDLRTMAELSAEEKNRISHRKKALLKLLEFFKENLCQKQRQRQ